MEADITIIGAGPGGYVCAIRAAQLGLKTVIVEADKLGGECLNYGCIPSKSLITVSKLVSRIKEAEKFGLKTSGVMVDFEQLQKWKGEVVGKLVGGVEALLKGNKVTIVMGEAEVKDSHSIVVTSGSSHEEIKTKCIVIATGTTPVQLPGLEFDGKIVIGSRQALEMKSAPKGVLIVGGGAIGLEFASLYQKLGSSITIVEIMDQLLPGTDPEVVRVVQRKLEGSGAKIHLKSKVTGVKKDGPSAKVGVLTPSGEVEVDTDLVLVSVGRKPTTKGLNLASLGVATNERGFIITDEKMQTSVPGIYAIGDVRGPPLLAHKASKEGMVAAECAAGLPSAADWTVVPDAVFCDPEVAGAGMTEARALEAGYKIVKSRFQFAALGRALSTGESEGFVKLISDANGGRVLGAQIVGPEASNLISEVALAIEMGATVEDIALTIHPHPTLPEAIMEASETSAGRPVHQLKM